MTCRVCTSPEAGVWRQEWGCDGPTEKPALLVDGCWRCSGTDKACELCGGTDRVSIHECPRRTVPAEAYAVTQHAELLAAQLTAWPVAGGTMDQAHVFWDALLFVLSRRADLIARPKGAGNGP
jgi:hypothetical protein